MKTELRNIFSNPSLKFIQPVPLKKRHFFSWNYVKSVIRSGVIFAADSYVFPSSTAGFLRLETKFLSKLSKVKHSNSTPIPVPPNDSIPIKVPYPHQFPLRRRWPTLPKRSWSRSHLTWDMRRYSLQSGLQGLHPTKSFASCLYWILLIFLIWQSPVLLDCK